MDNLGTNKMQLNGNFQFDYKQILVGGNQFLCFAKMQKLRELNIGQNYPYMPSNYYFLLNICCN